MLGNYLLNGQALSRVLVPQKRDQKTSTCIDCGGPCARTRGAKRCRNCYGLHAKRVAELNNQRTCCHCGVVFRMKQSGKTKGLYCTRKCAALAQRDAGKRPPPTPPSYYKGSGKHCRVRFPTCLDCGRVYTARRKGERCHACLEIKQAKRLSPRYCVVCKAVELERKQGLRLCAHCGEIARAIARKKGRRVRRRKYGKDWRQIARTRGVAYEPVNRLTVFERDGWICQLCGKPTNPKAPRTHNSAPSLDHRIPISLGGPHLYSNVQCAHLKCNVMKGNRSERGQLPLWNQ
jgi:5-methylcytosine-specific restriction endonuclease McrA